MKRKPKKAFHKITFINHIFSPGSGSLELSPA